MSLSFLAGRPRVVRLAILVGLALAGCGSPPREAAPAPAGPTPAGTGGLNRPEYQDRPYVVLVSIDGFRADYLDTIDLPHLRRVAQRGARAQALVPVFPTVTFPNHYSLVTGLRPERHGIVANTFYDPARGQTYSMSDGAAVTDGSWYRGEPIWVTAELQGMVAACFFWPGSEAAIKGVRPTLWKPYRASTPNEERVDGVLDWLRLPSHQRPHVVTLYFSELDAVSHREPMQSPAIATAAHSIDRVIGRLMAGIDTLPIRDRVYVLLTSDHGMVETGVSQTIRLDSLLDPSKLRAFFGGPVAHLHVNDGAAGARAVRDEINARLEHGRAYLRDDLPAHLSYRADPRIGDVVVLMDEPWMLATSPGTARNTDRWGMHGWDATLPSMRALFLVTGPGIRAGLTVPDVQNVDVYPFMAELLGLRIPADLDGRPGHLRALVWAAGE
jgi:predicted AlkP superfamily pyrophosphatase or phosphodiesterase